ncbi:MAG TPA: penicillin-binding protein [Anaeromyxobacteraceae bacterium]|nr:penicillin-binding protein [Anaeromyxobacteraceae bacterium]
MGTDAAARPARWAVVRIAMLAALLAVGFAGIALRAVQLQVLERERLGEEARDQYVRQLVLRPRRGVVTDRAGVLLAGSADVESVFADPEVLARAGGAPRALRKLASALGVDARALQRRLARGSRFVWVKRRVSPAEAAAVRRLDLPGVGLVPETRRYYPKGTLAAALLGIVGDDGEGLEGVELALDDVLRGEPTRVPSLRDGSGRLALHDAPGTERREGARVELTVDQGLQLAAERALEAAVRGSQALSGVAIALDPRSGEILAMASYPGFNPNAFRAGDPMRNRAVADTHEPGSTVKTFTIAGALERGALRPLDPVDCGNGTYAVGGHVFRDHKALGWTGASRILAVSSNVGAAKIGARLGRGGLEETMRAFGFGERTGIGLPGEARGQMPPPRSDIAVATQSFGHGMTATPLQVTSAMAALANGGLLVRPFVLRRVVDPATGEVLEEGRTLPVRRAVSPEVAATLTRWLAGVVEDPEGTGRRARPEGWRVAGKTGTARKVDPVSGGYAVDRHFSSFVGFAPLESPRIAIGVFVDEPQGERNGGEVAAPAFREIAEYALKMLGVPPTGPLAAQPAPPSPPAPAGSPPAEAPPEPPEVEQLARGGARPSGGVAVPSLRGLSVRAALRRLEALDLGGEIEGSGRVSGQSPAPGATVARGARVRLRLAPPG